MKETASNRQGKDTTDHSGGSSHITHSLQKGGVMEYLRVLSELKTYQIPYDDLVRISVLK